MGLRDAHAVVGRDRGIAAGRRAVCQASPHRNQTQHASAQPQGFRGRRRPRVFVVRTFFPFPFPPSVALLLLHLLLPPFLSLDLISFFFLVVDGGGGKRDGQVGW